jgi:outer membrane protein TolC
MHHIRAILLALLLAGSASSAWSQVSDTELQSELRWNDPQWRARISKPLTMNDCVQIALENNLPLAIARMQRQESQEGVAAAKGDWWPSLSASSRRTSVWTRDPNNQTTLTTESVQTRVDAGLTQRLPFGGDISFGYSWSKTPDDRIAGYGGNATWTQPLLRNFGWTPAMADVKTANLSERSQEEALRAETLNIISTVHAAFYQVILAQQIIAVNERAIERDEALLEFSRAKVDAKLATRRDVLSAEIVLAQDRSRLVTAQTDYRARIDELGDVMGLPVPTTISIADTELQEETVEIRERDWIARAMRDNPSVRAARYDLENVELDLKLSRNARLPQLDFELSYDENRASVLSDAAVLGREVERAWEGAIIASMPIFNSRPRAETRAADLRHEQARRTLLETERQVGLLVREVIRDLQRSSDRIEVLKKTIEGALDKVEFANVNFQLGRADNFDITDAQKDLIEAETDYADELVSYYIALARLEELLGGSIQ